MVWRKFLQKPCLYFMYLDEIGVIEVSRTKIVLDLLSIRDLYAFGKKKSTTI